MMVSRVFVVVLLTICLIMQQSQSMISRPSYATLFRPNPKAPRIILGASSIERKSWNFSPKICAEKPVLRENTYYKMLSNELNAIVYSQENNTTKFGQLKMFHTSFIERFLWFAPDKRLSNQVSNQIKEQWPKLLQDANVAHTRFKTALLNTKKVSLSTKIIAVGYMIRCLIDFMVHLEACENFGSWYGDKFKMVHKYAEIIKTILEVDETRIDDDRIFRRTESVVPYDQYLPKKTTVRFSE